MKHTSMGSQGQADPIADGNVAMDDAIGGSIPQGGKAQGRQQV